MRPTHHVVSSRTQFQNPWMVSESSAAPPSDQTQDTSNYWPASLASLRLPTFPSLPSISIERVRESESHPHPPVKVVKPDWGRSGSPSPEPNVKATWLGHAVRHSFRFVALAFSSPLLSHCLLLARFCQSFLVEFPCIGSGPDDKPPRVLFDPIFSDCAGPSPWIGIRRHLPPPCTVAELPEV